MQKAFPRFFRPTRNRIIVAGVIVLLVLGCGKKGPPEAPELSAPNVVRGFNAVGDVRGVLLRWVAPITTLSGDELSDLAGFRVERREVVLGERFDFVPIADVEVPDPTETEAGLPPPVNFEYRDPEVRPGGAYEYRIIPYNVEGVRAKDQRMLRVVFLGESTTVEVY